MRASGRKAKQAKVVGRRERGHGGRGAHEGGLRVAREDAADAVRRIVERSTASARSWWYRTCETDPFLTILGT